MLVALAGVLSGTVLDGSGAAAPQASVVVRGQNLTLSATTDASGRFAFPTLPHGEYDLLASKGSLRAVDRVELTPAGADVQLRLAPLSTIHQSVVVHPAAPPVRGSGTDLTLNGAMLSNSPAATSFPSLLAQLPGAARGANGVVHINGDHGDINYVVDGVSIPQALNREIGSEFDVANAAYVDVLEGAYPAQYGGRFAAVINIGTRAGAGAPGFSGYADGGSYGSVDSSTEYHTPIGRGGLIVALHAGQTGYALDPPDPSSVHNQGSDVNQFLRFTLPNGSDYLNFTFSHSLQTFQIPNDLAGGEPADTDDSEIQNDTFAALQYRHAIGDRGMLSFGPSYKRSNILDFGDPHNDWTYGEAIHAASGGAPNDCIDAVVRGNFTPTTCAYSLYGNAVATDGAFNLDYELRGGNHDVRTGADYDVALVPKAYAVTLQPANFLAPIYAPKTPYAPYTVTDAAPNVGHTESAYVQDAWQMGSNVELDYGLRMDAFTLFSSEFQTGFSQFSPRLKLSRFFGKRAAVYAYYGRFFTPFSFQNVSPEAAYLLNLPLQRTPAAFDLRPQRDSVYEIGGHLPLGNGDIGLRVMQKNATDLIDDTQVGVTAFHQDINYAQGRIATQTAYYQLPLARNGRFYASLNHTYSVNKGCETQLLAPCFGSPSDWTPADHMQQWGATSGAVLADARGGWFSIDGEYGTGLSSSACAPTLQTLQCAYTPHLVFDAEKGVAIGHNLALTLRAGNLLNDRYYITYLNAQGNHYAQGRTLTLGVRYASP
ncbi:MAG: TonB-dependent receptor [Candidatus Eremiobacteraeota bacterium]|nr:TonB-dependent receptor [Candidatus Eremiobacteraeota bacterium]